mgnify:CR=1 FL=1
MVTLLPLFGVWLLAVISPGPDFLVTVRSATARSRRHGIMTGLGVSVAILVWATASMLGLSVLLVRISWIYDTIRWVGAAYLVYLGVRMLWAGWRREPATDPASGSGASGAPVARGGPAAPGRSVGLWRAWRTGFLTNIGNPKAAVFFGSLLGALLPADSSAPVRVAVVAVMVAIAAGWFTAVAVLFGMSPVVRGYRRVRRWTDRVMAVALIALGGRLAVER